MKVLSFLLLSVFLILAGADCFAQVSRGVSAAGRRNDDFDNQRTRAQRDSMEREMRAPKPSKEELANAARIKAETKEDLEGLQRAYNDTVLKLSTRGEIPSDFVTEGASRVNKHASRLKANIAFPKPAEGDTRKPLEIPADTRRRLHQMCTLIYELLTNPMIENPAVLDLDAAHSARIALDNVIAVSESLK